MLDKETHRKCTHEIGKRVKALRRSSGLTLHQVVLRSGMNISLLSKIENGSNITVETLFNVAQAFNVRACDLISGLPEAVKKKPRGRKKNEIKISETSE
jgi:transcriptional regulator with XRE-family HTH domain